jgi:hypothetical protein
MPSNNIHQIEAEALLAQILASSDPRRIRELRVKLQLAQQLAEREKAKGKPQ